MINSLYECFKHWSEKGSVYLIADPHFEDYDCGLMDSMWLTPEEHIQKIKAKVHKNDTLICLGDCGNPEWFSQIRGHKVLIKGNHDAGTANYTDYFDEIYEGPLFISEKILLSHEPILGLDFCTNIHGHDHSGRHIDDYHLNIASNVYNYEMLNLGEFIKQGGISKIQTIHRETINRASERKLEKLKKI